MSYSVWWRRDKNPELAGAIGFRVPKPHLLSREGAKVHIEAWDTLPGFYNLGLFRSVALYIASRTQLLGCKLAAGGWDLEPKHIEVIGGLIDRPLAIGAIDTDHASPRELSQRSGHIAVVGGDPRGDIGTLVTLSTGDPYENLHPRGRHGANRLHAVISGDRSEFDAAKLVRHGETVYLFKAPGDRLDDHLEQVLRKAQRHVAFELEVKSREPGDAITAMLAARDGLAGSNQSGVLALPITLGDAFAGLLEMQAGSWQHPKIPYGKQARERLFQLAAFDRLVTPDGRGEAGGVTIINPLIATPDEKIMDPKAVRNRSRFHQFMAARNPPISIERYARLRDAIEGDIRLLQQRVETTSGRAKTQGIEQTDVDVDGSAMDRIAVQVEQTVGQYRLIDPGTTVVVAFSGGKESTVVLEARWPG